ncbi:MAG: DUF2784 domain-containing protein [Chitinophagaceae bacterium]
MLSFLNIFFTVVHVLLILFNLTGWIWKKTRRWHIITLILTAASWAVLGIWYGWGYCPLTDWHWDVKNKLGETDLPNSFVKYLLDKIFSQDLSVALVDRITLWSLIAALLASVWVNFLAPAFVKPANKKS